jgi:hypothetical protein
VRHKDVDLHPNKLGRDISHVLILSVRPAIFDRDGAMVDPTKLIKPLHQCGDVTLDG